MTIEGLNITSVYNKSSEAMQRMGKDAVEDGYLVKGEDDENFVLENGSKFIVDWEEGQKTGFFLDQRNNRDLVRKLAKGKNVLNTFYDEKYRALPYVGVLRPEVYTET